MRDVRLKVIREMLEYKVWDRAKKRVRLLEKHGRALQVYKRVMLATESLAQFYTYKH